MRMLKILVLKDIFSKDIDHKKETNKKRDIDLWKELEVVLVSESLTL